jgi:hypothetical protein
MAQPPHHAATIHPHRDPPAPAGAARAAGWRSALILIRRASTDPLPRNDSTGAESGKPPGMSINLPRRARGVPGAPPGSSRPRG